ncbi:MAG: hypothetical protein Q7R70_07065 [Candidatus Diapherotrites archaeon]|nr:hypothetical protein [Candidatus Diapherotrites archaeon]
MPKKPFSKRTPQPESGMLRKKPGNEPLKSSEPEKKIGRKFPKEPMPFEENELHEGHPIEQVSLGHESTAYRADRRAESQSVNSKWHNAAEERLKGIKRRKRKEFFDKAKGKAKQVSVRAAKVSWVGLNTAGRKSREFLARDWQRTKADFKAAQGKVKSAGQKLKNSRTKIVSKYRGFKQRRIPDARIKRELDFLNSRISKLEGKKTNWEKRSRLAKASTSKGFQEHFNPLHKRFWSTRSRPVGGALKGFADWRVRRNQQMIDLEKRRREIIAPTPQAAQEPARKKQRKKPQE